MKKILYFESAGMEGTQRNDVENCRIRTAFTNNEGKKIYLELGGNEISKYNKQYDQYKDFEIGTAIMHIDFCFYITDDPEIDDCNKSRITLDENMKLILYTKKNILNLVNENLNCSFEEVVILPWLSGYYVHSGSHTRTSKDYNMMDDFKYNPKRTEERRRIYNEVATEYFDKIYKKHAEEKTTAARLYKPMSRSHSIVSMDDKSITIRSHTYKELIDADERVKVFEVVY